MKYSADIGATISSEEEQPIVNAVSRPISAVAWYILVLITFVTFAGFMALDPHPSLLLSISVAANVAIMLGALYRLYAWDLLLSPMMMFVGLTMIMYYSWGNLGARIAGASRYFGVLGALDFYPIAALLSTIGLAIYCWVVFGIFQKTVRHVAIKYQDLYWRPRQVVAISFLTVAIFTYLSTKYSFIGGYFRGASGHFDRWLIQSAGAFVFLMAIVSTSVFVKAVDRRSRLLALSGLILSIVLVVGLRSRTFMLMVLLIIVFCWLTLKPNQARPSFFLTVALIGIIIFSLGSVVKYSQNQSSSIFDNLYEIGRTSRSKTMMITQNAVETDSTYRVGGFEYPSAILRCLDYGAAPAYGRGFIGAILQGLPGFLRPPGNFTERGNISIHFWKYCHIPDDIIGIPLVSGIGDWGMLGVFIYALFGFFSVLLWRVAQISPRLFMAYLIVPLFPDSFFWDGVFTYIKMMSFLWIVLWLLGPVVMPYWSSKDDRNRKMT